MDAEAGDMAEEVAERLERLGHKHEAGEVLSLHLEALEASRRPLVYKYGFIENLPLVHGKARTLANWLHRKGKRHHGERIGSNGLSGLEELGHDIVAPHAGLPTQLHNPSGFVSPDLRSDSALAKLAQAGQAVRSGQTELPTTEPPHEHRNVLGEYPMERSQLRDHGDIGKALFEQHITIPPDTTKLLIVMATKSGQEKRVVEWAVANGATTNVHCVIDSAIGAIHSTSVMLGHVKEKTEVEQKEDWLSHVDLDKLYDFGPDPPDIKIRPHG